MREVLELVAAGDLGATRVVNDAGRAIGRVLADLCNALNPEAIIVGGELSEAGEPLLGGIRDAIDRYALPGAAQVVGRPGELGERAEVARRARARHRRASKLCTPIGRKTLVSCGTAAVASRPRGVPWAERRTCTRRRASEGSNRTRLSNQKEEGIK